MADTFHRKVIVVIKATSTEIEKGEIISYKAGKREISIVQDQ